MGFVEKIKNNPRLKKLSLLLLMPKNQARPRLWVRLFLNPFIHKKGKQTVIRRSARMDVLPFNKFYIGRNSIIEGSCTINNGVGDVIIGDRSKIGIANVVIGPINIGNDCIFAQNIVLSGLNHGYEDVNLPPENQSVTTSAINVEDEVWIGANAVVVAGITIGKHSVVAAGSVVTKNVPPYSVVGGNPAKVLKQYNSETKKWERIK